MIGAAVVPTKGPRIVWSAVSATSTMPSGTASMAAGALNRAIAPVPSARPLTPAIPPTVVTVPSDTIARMVLLPVSAMYSVPLASIAIPDGLEKRAAVPTSSTLPGAPAAPAIVVVSPVAVTRRIVWLPVSATYRVPEPSTAIPDGFQKRAANPEPSALPLLPANPASVVTLPFGAIRRIVWLPESATYSTPATSIATARGRLNRAADPVPSTAPANPAA